jgi:ubiquinone/menaquinone biosynthesis C-methylase UbiE
MLELEPGQAVLEVGRGSGVFLPALAQAVGKAGRVVGVDLAEPFFTQAQQRMGSAGLAGVVSVQRADACRLPFADASFDAVHCERVLMHLDDPDLALREMARVLRPGGVAVAAEPDRGGFRLDHADRAGFDVLYAR